VQDDLLVLKLTLTSTVTKDNSEVCCSATARVAIPPPRSGWSAAAKKAVDGPCLRRTRRAAKLYMLRRARGSLVRRGRPAAPADYDPARAGGWG
jgi:hypothetical protein